MTALPLVFSLAVSFAGLGSPEHEITPKHLDYNDFHFDVVWQTKRIHDQLEIYEVVICVSPGECKNYSGNARIELWKNQAFVYAAELRSKSLPSLPGPLQTRVKDIGAMFFTFNISPEYVREARFSYEVYEERVAVCTLRLKDFMLAPAGKGEPQSQLESAPVIEQSTPPVIELWNGGIYLAHIQPYVLFAAWPDGTVVRRQGNRLKAGRVTPDAMKRLLEQVKNAGVLNPPLEYGMMVADGPLFTLCVRTDGRTIRLNHDGSTELRDVSPNSYPPKDKKEAFVKMWKQAEDAINALDVPNMTDVTGDLPVSYPSR